MIIKGCVKRNTVWAQKFISSSFSLYIIAYYLEVYMFITVCGGLYLMVMKLTVHLIVISGNEICLDIHFRRGSNLGPLDHCSGCR